MPLSLQNIGYIVTTTNGLSVRSISSLEREQLPVLTRDCTLAPADVLLTQRSPGQPCSPTLLLFGLPGAKGSSQRQHLRTCLREEEGLHYPCPLTQHGGVLRAGPGPCF